MLENTLNGQTLDIVSENVQKLKALFPEIVSEDKIDFEKLQAVLGEYIENDNERYNFTWNGKGRALRLSQTPSTGTLRPCKEESKEWDTTQNLYIEGDNLEVLKLLQKTYHNKIKMIYIDPPYNTGKDFVYPDDYKDNLDNYLRITGQKSEDGSRISTNSETSGRYHTNWLNMIYPRLRVARDILAEDGVIFISIDDNEVHNLRKICDEIYGQSNFVAKVIWERSFAPVNLKKHFSNSHDYILCYAKNLNMLICNGLPRSEGTDNNYKNLDNDPRGLWTSSDMTVGPVISEKLYDITLPSGRKIKPTSGRCWLYTKDKYEEMVKDNRIWFGKSGDNTPRVKKFLSEVKQGITPMTIWKYSEVEHSQEAAQNLKKLFDGKDYFDYPKPVKLIKRMLELYTNSDSIIVDFFSGSATTAHSVMQLNTEDEGERKFIMVQIPEETDPKSEAYKDGYRDICEIGKERIRRAGTKIKEEAGLTAQNLDTGFRVLKLDSSNMKEVYYTPEEYSQMGFNLEGFMDNIKPDRSDEDLLFQVMLDLGIPLSARIEQDGKIFKVNENYLIACFDRVDTSMITEIAQKQPYYAIFRDSSFVNDSALVNVEQIFNTYSPSTIRRVL